MTEELKPCPFCGESEMALGQQGAEAWIACRICSAAGPRWSGGRMAIHAWNMRRTEPPQPALSLIGLPVIDPSLMEVGK